MLMHQLVDTTPTNTDHSKNMEVSPHTMYQPVDLPTTRNTVPHALATLTPQLVDINIILLQLVATMLLLAVFREEVEDLTLLLEVAMMISTRPIWLLMNKPMGEFMFRCRSPFTH